ncbi:HAD family hydrolase [Terriglobus sp.]|uniref:HAD family hydrolase n=1 Tax=Terriglobus sp. TaxID=1889013 RepID=UPI003B000567
MDDPLHLPPGHFKAYLFDLDGTVADTMPLHFVCWNEALGLHGCSLDETQFFALAGIPVVETIELLNRQHGLTMPARELAEYKEALFLKRLVELKPVEAVVAHVHEAHGRIPLAIVSGSPRASILHSLGMLGLTERFEVIVGAEDYARGKPDPEPFLTAAARLGVMPQDCLVFEDADLGIQAAKAAGMQWVKVPQPALG